MTANSDKPVLSDLSTEGAVRLGPLDTTVIERAARAIYEFDETITDNDAKNAGRLLVNPRLTWEKLCEDQPSIAEAYRARSKAALLAAMGAS